MTAESPFADEWDEVFPTGATGYDEYGCVNQTPSSIVLEEGRRFAYCQFR